MTPFMALYGKESSDIPHFTEGDSTIKAVGINLQLRQETLQKIKKNLELAQNRMRLQANKGRSDISFEVGDWVLVKLTPYRQTTAAYRLHNKLGKKYFGPYKISRKINEVAYHLELPTGSRIHPAFHVSKLRRFLGSPPENSEATEPLISIDNKPIIYPMAILNHK